MGDKMSYEREKARQEMAREIAQAHQIGRDRKEYSTQVFLASVALAAFDNRPPPSPGMDQTMRVQGYVEMATQLLRRCDLAAEHEFPATPKAEE